MREFMSRRRFLAGVSGGALSLAAAPLLRATADDAIQPKPNIVVILADDLGYADVGCYGQQRILTPHVDRMAAEGLRFTQCYAGAPVCAPSRCCLMTGLHNGHGRIRDNLPHEIWLQPDDFTVAEYLKQAGYRTAAIGKWSLGNPGSWGIANFQGFDYFYGHLDQDQAHFYYPDYLWENEKIVHLTGNRGGKHGEYTNDLFAEKALDFIRENHQRPFFLYLAVTIPHYSDHDRDSPDSLLVPSNEPYEDQPWPEVEKRYAAMVTRMDGYVGRILGTLRELGLDENTIVFFTSDNGPSAERLHSVDFFDSNGIFRGVKRDLYEGALRVPMVVRWPGHVPAGIVSEEPWAFWDVLPTLGELAGLPPVQGLDGISMTPTLLGRRQERRHDYFYWDYAHVRGTFTQALRWGNWKGLRKGLKGEVELYDLSTDPSESRNVASQHPDVAARISAYLAEAYVPSPDYPIAEPT